MRVILDVRRGARPGQPARAFPGRGDFTREGMGVSRNHRGRVIRGEREGPVRVLMARKAGQPCGPWEAGRGGMWTWAHSVSRRQPGERACHNPWPDPSFSPSCSLCGFKFPLRLCQFPPRAAFCFPSQGLLRCLGFVSQFGGAGEFTCRAALPVDSFVGFSRILEDTAR